MTRTGATLAGRLWVMRSLVTQYGPVAQCGSDQRSRSNPLFHCLPEFTIVPLLLIDARSMPDRCPIDVGKMQSSAGYNSWVGGRVDRSSATALTRVDWRYSLSLAFFGVSETSDHPSKEARSRDHDDKHDSLGELSRVASNATWGVFPFGGRRENPVGVTPQLGGKTKVV